MNCDESKGVLLDHLYGALEEAEESAVLEHLAACAACRGAIEEARGQKALLAEAARGEAGDLAFAPPARGRAARIWRAAASRRGMAAAAALIAVAGLLGTRAHIRAEAASRYPVLTVQGPRTVSAGAPAEFVVRADAADGTPVAESFRVDLLGADGKPVATGRASAGEARLRLPETAGKPGEVVPVRLLASFADGQAFLSAMVVRDSRGLLARASTDKPLYRPGQPVRARGLVLERFRLVPAGTLAVRMKLLDPKGATASEEVVATRDGVAAWETALPADAAGGEWSVGLSHDEGAFPETSRKILVAAYRPPRLKTDIELSRDSFGPGGKGEAWVKVERAEGGVPAGGSCEAILVVDGKEASRQTLPVSANGANGRLVVPLALPAEIEEGRAHLALVFTDGGTTETAAKTVPVTLGRLDVSCFPEGGDLVAGLPNRVYFEVRDPRGEPADLLGDVVDSTGTRVAEARVEVRGLGRLDLTPRAGESYRLVPRTPAGVSLRGEFPRPLAGGVILRSLDDVSPATGPVRLELMSTIAGNHTVAAWCRGTMVAQEIVPLRPGERRPVELRPTVEAGGVLRVTVYDPTGVPRAERLVSLEPASRLAVEVKPERDAYSSAETVKVTVTTRDETGKPVPATLGVAVADDAIVKLADDRDTPDLPLHFLLGLEVKELEEVRVYSKGPESARAVDLLLGVQGWRRFAWKDPQAFLAANTKDGPRVVVPSAKAEAPQRVDNAAWAAAAFAREAEELDRKFLLAAGAGLLVLGLAWAAVVTWRAAPRVEWRILGGLGTGCAGAVIGIGALERPPETGIEDLYVVSVNPADAQTNIYTSDQVVLRFSTPLDPASFTGHVNQITQLYQTTRQVPDAAGGQPITVLPSVVAGGVAVHLGSLRVAGIQDGNLTRAVAGVRLYSDTPLPVGTLEVNDLTLSNWAGWWGNNQWDWTRVDAGIALATAGVWASNGLYWVPAGAPGTFVQTGSLSSARSVEFASRVAALFREYAHRKRADHDGTRRDFAEVLYWNPLVVTDKDGKASFEFDTSDSVTSFLVSVDANDARGALATATGTLRNRLPFFIEPKLPLELSAGDRLLLPVSVANETDSPMAVRVALATGGDLLRAEGGTERAADLPARGRGRILFDVRAGQGRGEVPISLTGFAAGAAGDDVKRAVPVVPRGYPLEIARSGVLSKRAESAFVLPDRLDRATLSGSLRLYPSLLATLADGLEGMLRTPGGCFEQVSSTHYPNALVLSYLAEYGLAAPDLARRAKQLLSDGYGKLAAYECRRGGFEWWGKDPGHQSLTAYGLMEFADTAAVHDVDRALLARTKAWLLARRDGKGGFRGDESDSHAFGRAPREISDAYVVWALAQADPGLDLGPELRLLEERARASDDPYLVALAANALGSRRAPGAADLLAKLARAQGPDGRLAGKTTSITCSGGANLDVETTSLAAMAFLRDPVRLAEAGRAVTWIHEQRRASGSFGATQATVLALKALVAHARAARRTASAHDLTIRVNDAVVANRHLAEGETGVVAFGKEFLDALRPGENRILLETTGSEALPWAVGLRLHADRPPTDEKCKVRSEARLDRDSVAEGETVACTVALRNATDTALPMALVRLGLPAGLEPRADQLRELKESGAVDFYETRPREVTLYWRGLAASGEKRLSLDLVAAIPGEFEGPATSVYLYYDDDAKAWSAPLRVRIQPRD